jgi:zinc transport system ATP-binding protein
MNNINAIELNGVNVSFGNFQALENINLTIPSGKFVSILGPNGSGKSTLLRVLTGIISPQNGEISIFGKNIKELSSDTIGYVPQIKTLDKSFPAIGIELVLSGINHRWALKSSKEQKEKAFYILEQLNAHEYAEKPLNQLSGGQLQRIYLARSLVREPQLLLLDEPATGIDLICETNLNSIIQKFSKNNLTTILMVTHDWTSAYAHTEEILLMNRKIIFYGSKEAAFSNENLRQTFSHFSDKHNVSFGLTSND